MMDRNTFYTGKSSAVVSLPMYAKYANKNMNDVGFERLILRLQDGISEDDYLEVISDLKRGLDWKQYSV